jgi:hypothetical protein
MGASIAGSRERSGWGAAHEEERKRGVLKVTKFQECRRGRESVIQGGGYFSIQDLNVKLMRHQAVKFQASCIH